MTHLEFFEIYLLGNGCQIIIDMDRVTVNFKGPAGWSAARGPPRKNMKQFLQERELFYRAPSTKAQRVTRLSAHNLPIPRAPMTMEPKELELDQITIQLIKEAREKVGSDAEACRTVASPLSLLLSSVSSPLFSCVSSHLLCLLLSPLSPLLCLRFFIVWFLFIIESWTTYLESFIMPKSRHWSKWSIL